MSKICLCKNPSLLILSQTHLQTANRGSQVNVAYIRVETHAYIYIPKTTV